MRYVRHSKATAAKKARVPMKADGLMGRRMSGLSAGNLVGQAEHVAERPGYAAVPHLWSRGDGSVLRAGLEAQIISPGHTMVTPLRYPQDLWPKEVNGLA